MKPDFPPSWTPLAGLTFPAVVAWSFNTAPMVREHLVKPGQRADSMGDRSARTAARYQRQLPARSPPPAAIERHPETRALGTRRSLCSVISPAACSAFTSRSPR